MIHAMLHLAMTESPWFPIVLLLAVAAYATWRTVIYFKTNRPAIGIALSFLILFCIYETTLRIIAIINGSGGAGGG